LNTTGTRSETKKQPWSKGDCTVKKYFIPFISQSISSIIKLINGFALINWCLLRHLDWKKLI
jgi:hypothetical protein